MSEITRRSACAPARNWTHPIPKWVEPGRAVVLREKLDMADEFTLSVGRRALVASVDDVWVKVSVLEANEGPAIEVTQRRGEFDYFWGPDENELRTET